MCQCKVLEYIKTAIIASFLLILFNHMFVLACPPFLYPYLFEKFLLYYPAPLIWFITKLIDLNSFFYSFLPYVFGWVWPLIVTCVGAPILEEIEFRGALLWLTKIGAKRNIRIIYAILSSIIFALCHTVPLGYMVTIGAMGLLSCWLVTKTKRLWPSVALHSLYNLTVTFI